MPTADIRPITSISDFLNIFPSYLKILEDGYWLQDLFLQEFYRRTEQNPSGKPGFFE